MRALDLHPERRHTINNPKREVTVFLDLATCDRSRFDGVLLVPDVHAHPEAFEAAIARASKDCLFVLQLGDLVDRGPSSAVTVALARELEDAGSGAFIVGNHEEKLVGLVRHGLYASPRRIETRDELAAYGDGLLEWFVERVATGPVWARAPKLVAAHAAFHPEMVAEQPRLTEAVRERALFGVREQAADKRRPVRSQRWVDEIPNGLRVVVGHEVVRTDEPAVITGRRRGLAVMLDTGGWRDGCWSTLPLSWDDLGL